MVFCEARDPQSFRRWHIRERPPAAVALTAQAGERSTARCGEEVHRDLLVVADRPQSLRHACAGCRAGVAA